MWRGISGLALGIVMTAAASAADASAFDEGHADHVAFEAWFNSISGPFRDGAAFWAAHRSDPNPPSCAGSGNNAAFAMGCLQAAQRLGRSDDRRRSEPAYKAGWNSPLEAVAVRSGPFVFECGPESDGSKSVYTIDTDQRSVTMDAYNAAGHKICTVRFRDGVNGPITSAELCSGLVGALSSGPVSQLVTIEGGVVTYGTANESYGGFHTGNAHLNLTSGVLIDTNGTSERCRALSR